MSVTRVTDEGSFTKGSKDIINAGLGDCFVPSAQLAVVSSTTLATIPNMTTPLEIGTYVVNADLVGTANASGGWKVAFNYANGLTLSAIDVSGWGYTASSVVFPNRVSSTTTQTAIISSTSAMVNGEIAGTITVSNPGVLEVQFAQNASNAASSIIYTGSVVNVRKLV